MKELNIKGLKAAVFDWDNTLAQSRPPLVYAINTVLREYDMPDWETVKQLRDNNLSFKDNFPRIFGSNADEAYEKYKQIYLKIVKDLIRAFPKTTETLRFFKDNNVPVMIMTNKDRELLEYELPVLFDPALFDKIVCGHEAGRDKPEADHLIYTLQGFLNPFQINATNVWLIGDSPQDSGCAQRTGARAIRIGKDIWNDENETLEDVLFFDSFVDFYQELLLSN